MKPGSRRRNKAKGDLAELRAARQLREQGYVVHRMLRSGVQVGRRHFTHAQDAFACIDLIAKPRAPASDTRTRWIQVTAGRDVGRRVAKLSAVPWDRAHDSVELWRWVPGSGKRIDGRTGAARRTMYFLVYHGDRGFTHPRRHADPP
jgi:hypothetical protein